MNLVFYIYILQQVIIMCKINGNNNINLNAIFDVEFFNIIEVTYCNNQNCYCIIDIIANIYNRPNLTVNEFIIKNNKYITEIPTIGLQSINNTEIKNLSIINCPNLIDISNIKIINDLTIRNCPKLENIKLNEVRGNFTIQYCNNSIISHGRIWYLFIIEHCSNLIMSSNYEGSSQLIITDSKDITFPANKIWIQDLTIENCENITFK